VKVNIFDRDFAALLDSGSSISLIPSELEDYLKYLGLKTSGEEIQISTADGTPHSLNESFNFL
jgi:hypothetical protein